jgi:AcrR family transcriptional regulator
MTSSRRIGSKTSVVRDAILTGAIEVLQEEGGAALTASNIAKRIGVKAHLVHYYFRSMEDLVLALVRQHGELGLSNTARAIASDQPLRALWEIESTYKWSLVAMELGTFAAHHELVRAEMKRCIEELRRLQSEGIARHFELRGIEPPMPPTALTIIVAGIARQMVREKEFDVSMGHDELVAVVEEFLDSLGSAAGNHERAAAHVTSAPVP